MKRQDILLLQKIKGYPSVTITLPTHRTSPENKQDPIRLRNLIKQADERLLKEFGKREVQPILNRLTGLADGIDFRYSLDGLALFVNRDVGHVYHLPFSVKERLVVDETFLTRDLVFAMNRTPRYWTLVLSEKPTRLYEGTLGNLIEVEEGGFPMTHEGPGGEAPLPGGAGINKSAHRDERHRQFFRQVDAGLKPFLAEDPLPVALVAVERYLAFYKEMTDNKNAIVAEVEGSHDKTPPHDLAKLVWPAVEAGLEKKRLEVTSELEKAAGERKLVSTIGEVWRLAQEGRGRILLVEESFHSPGRVDKSGLNLVPAEDPAEPGVMDDAVDEIIEAVLARQGRVVFLPDGHLSEHQRIALILRY